MLQLPYMSYQKLQSSVASAEKILILQADNPDADSLGTALALEQILHDLGKQTYLYCGVDMPDYLKYLKGGAGCYLNFRVALI